MTTLQVCQQNAPYTVDKPSDLGINSEEAIWPSVAEYKDGQTPSLYNTKETMLANFLQRYICRHSNRN